MTSSLSLRPLALAVCTVLCPGGVQAAAQEVDALLSLSLEELVSLPIVTASRRSEARDHTPAHVIVITQRQIRERQYRDLADLLESLPGVDFMRGTRSARYNNFSLQGYTSSNKLLIMLDGVRIDHPTGGRVAVAENYPLYHVKQVEVVYGPAAALYGADAVAGVINIITEQAEGVPQAQVTLTTGRFGSQEAHFFAAAEVADQVSLSVGGHGQRSDRAPLDRYYPEDFAPADARTFDGTLVIPAEAREAFSGEIASRSLFARLDVGERVSFGYFSSMFRQLTSVGDRPDTAIFTPDARSQTQTQTAYARFRLPLGERVRTQLQLDYSRLELDPSSKYLNIYTSFADLGYLYSRSDRRGLEQTLDVQLSEAHQVQAGLGYQSYRTIQAPDMPQPYDRSLGVGGQGLVHANTDLPLPIPHAEYDNSYAYVQLQSDWQPGVSTMVGLRYDRHSGYGNTLIPRLGGSWRVNDRHVLKALYGESFRAPSPDEILTTYGSFTGVKNEHGQYLGSGFHVPNPNLKPERARTYSLTWEWRPRANVNVVTNFYHSRIKNLIGNVDERHSTQFIPGAVLSNTTRKVNGGDQSQTGLDVLAQWRFHLGHGWRGDGWGSFSLIDGEVREQGDVSPMDLSYIAPRKARLGATFRYRDRFTITPSVLWTDDVATERAHPSKAGQRRVAKAYTRVDLSLGWHLGRQSASSVWLSVENLLDRRYYAAHGSASTTFVAMPQQPRTWMLSYEYRL